MVIINDSDEHDGDDDDGDGDDDWHTFSHISWTQLILALPNPLNPSWQLYKALWSPDKDQDGYLMMII